MTSVNHSNAKCELDGGVGNSVIGGRRVDDSRNFKPCIQKLQKSFPRPTIVLHHGHLRPQPIHQHNRNNSPPVPDQTPHNNRDAAKDVDRREHIEDVGSCRIWFS
jgi:hypothetical protein